jgi:hypothetical protein
MWFRDRILSSRRTGQGLHCLIDGTPRAKDRTMLSRAVREPALTCLPANLFVNIWKASMMGAWFLMGYALPGADLLILVGDHCG